MCSSPLSYLRRGWQVIIGTLQTLAVGMAGAGGQSCQAARPPRRGLSCLVAGAAIKMVMAMAMIDVGGGACDVWWVISDGGCGGGACDVW